MFDVFKSYITDHAGLTAEEIEDIRLLTIVKKIRKKQLLLQEGDISRYKIFVTKGLLRTYRVRDDGTEHIIRFSPENWWSTDLESYNLQVPSKYNIDALEDSEVLLWTKDNFDQLMERIPLLKKFSELLISKSFNVSQERIFLNISYTAEEKYEEFIKSYPEVFKRLPLHMVASYLGVSRETLSRIRHTQANK